MQTIETRGARIPLLGLGTLGMRGDVCVDSVAQALRIGYRHLDTAAGYLNEREVGDGIRASGVPREEIFVTTKVPPTELKPEDFERCVETRLAKLGFPSVDLLLIHWYNPEVPMRQAIKSLCEAKRRGQARHIGVSNFTCGLLDEAMALTDEPLLTNQIELHPFLNQNKIVAACQKYGIVVTAYAPLARGKAFDNDTLRKIALAHDASVAQVMLRYVIQQGHVAIAQSDNYEHMRSNLRVFDFTLSAVEIADLTALNGAGLRVVNPSFAPAWD